MCPFGFHQHIRVVVPRSAGFYRGWAPTCPWRIVIRTIPRYYGGSVGLPAVRCADGRMVGQDDLALKPSCAGPREAVCDLRADWLVGV